jgi:N-acetylneuraminate lyase
MLNGILAAVVTPLDANQRFYPPAFETLSRSLYGSGVQGLYVCGQTGEGMLQTPAQRKQVAETAVKCSPDGASVVIHVGAPHIGDAIDLARHAAEIGATAISSLPPNGATSVENIREYYWTLANATDLPFLIYYYPEICPAIAEGNLLADLLALPSVVGLKFTDFDLFRVWRLRRQDKIVFNGRDEVLAAGLMMGASGGIGSFYNLVPELFLQIWEASRRHCWEEAQTAQNRVNELIEIVLDFPMISAIKTILRWSGIDCGQCLPPHRPLTADEEVTLRQRLLQSEVGTMGYSGVRVG